MLRIILFFIFLGINSITCAQETIQVSAKFGSGVTEKYHVLKTNDTVKQGLYQAYYNRKTIIASGGYTQGKKTGIWHFYDSQGAIIQHYNYDKKQLQYVTQEDPHGKLVQYDFVTKPKPTDQVSLPIRIGGNFYGYLPYVKLFKAALHDYTTDQVYGVLELLVSPIGRLAECRLFVKRRYYDDVIDTYNLNIELLNEDDREFIPAAINHENITSTIYVFCKVKGNGSITIF